MGMEGSPLRKEWIATAIGAGVGLLSSVIGGAASARAARKAQEEQRKREAQENAWYTRRYNEDYIDTAAGQNLVRRAKQAANEIWKRELGRMIVGGGTEAAGAMAKEQGNKLVGETIASVAATDQAGKRQLDDMHQRNQQQFANDRIQTHLNNAEQIKTAAQGAANAASSAGAAVDQATTKSPNLTGSSNNSTIASTPPLVDDAWREEELARKGRMGI